MIKKTTQFAKTHWLKVALPLIGCIGGVLLDTTSLEEEKDESVSVTSALLLPLHTDRKVDRLTEETRQAFEEAFAKDSLQMEMIKEIIASQRLQTQQNHILCENMSSIAGRIDGLIIGMRLHVQVEPPSKKDSTKPCQSISLTE